jgi:hypothetical protein
MPSTYLIAGFLRCFGREDQGMATSEARRTRTADRIFEAVEKASPALAARAPEPSLNAHAGPELPFVAGENRSGHP